MKIITDSFLQGAEESVIIRKDDDEELINQVMDVTYEEEEPIVEEVDGPIDINDYFLNPDNVRADGAKTFRDKPTSNK